MQHNADYVLGNFMWRECLWEKSQISSNTRGTTAHSFGSTRLRTLLNMKVGERLNFGRTFKAEVLAGNIPFVSYIGKAQNNSAKYKKER